MPEPRFNLHCHSRHSDGAASPRELAEAAVRAGLSHLGICDHFATAKLEAGRSLSLERLPDYIDELRSLRAQLADRLVLLAGVEVSFSLLQTDFTFLGRVEPSANPLNRLDYVLFEYVNDGEWFGLGLEELLKLRPLLEVPVGLAHNDLERNFAGVVQPEVLARILAGAQVFVELAPGRRHARREADRPDLPYYRVPGEFNRRFFGAAAAAGVKLSVGSDVHADLADVGAVDDAFAFLREHGLEASAVVRHYWRSRR